MTPGLLDANIFIHAHASDRHTAECRRFLAALENGQAQARLEPITVHELSYALPRYIKQMSRADVGEYLLTILQWPGVEGELDLLVEAVSIWMASPSIGFADAYLAARARELECPVFTKNLRDFAGLAVEAQEQLPG